MEGVSTTPSSLAEIQVSAKSNLDASNRQQRVSPENTVGLGQFISIADDAKVTLSQCNGDRWILAAIDRAKVAMPVTPFYSSSSNFNVGPFATRGVDELSADLDVRQPMLVGFS